MTKELKVIYETEELSPPPEVSISTDIAGVFADIICDYCGDKLKKQRILYDGKNFCGCECHKKYVYSEQEKEKEGEETSKQYQALFDEIKEKDKQIKALCGQVEVLQEELKATKLTHAAESDGLESAGNQYFVSERNFEKRDVGMKTLEQYNQRLEDNLSIVLKEKEALIAENKNLKKIVKIVRVAVE